MTRSEIADYLGLTIETVSRTLSRFKLDRRIATPSNNEVIILDRAWLDRHGRRAYSGLRHFWRQPPFDRPAATIRS